MSVRRSDAIHGVPGAAAPIKGDRLDRLEGDTAWQCDRVGVEDAVAVGVERYVVACTIVVDGDGCSFSSVVGVTANGKDASFLDVGSVFAGSR